MAQLKQLFDALHDDVSISSPEEIKESCELIIEVQAMGSDERDCIKAMYRHGPLFDGDIPSKFGRDKLLSKGYAAKVVVKGSDGYNACTYKGARAYKLIMVAS